LAETEAPDGAGNGENNNKGVEDEMDPPDEPEPYVCVPDGMEVSKAGLRRLKPDQFVASAEQWIGVEQLEIDLDPDQAISVTALAAEKLALAATDMSTKDSAARREFLACANNNAQTQKTCTEAFLLKFGQHVFRRPVEADEKAWLLSLYDRMLPELRFEETASALLEVILQVPQALYVPEIGTESVSGQEGVSALSGIERATRLALFMWGRTPNEALIAKAAAGDLDTVEGVKATAKEMLADPLAGAMIQDFFTRWLELDGTNLHPGLDDVSKDEAKFPELDDALRRAMRIETEAFVKDVLQSEDASYRALWTSRRAYVNKELAALYNTPFAEGAEEFQWVELPEEQRAGILTRSAFLALYAHGSYQSPILRGAAVLNKVFCAYPGEPPPDVDDSPVAPKEPDPSAVLSV